MAALPCLARWANKAVEGDGVRDGNAAVPKIGKPESRTGERAAEPESRTGERAAEPQSRTGESAGQPDGALKPGRQSPVCKFDTNSLAVPKAHIHPAITGESQEWQRQ